MMGELIYKYIVLEVLYNKKWRKYLYLFDKDPCWSKYYPLWIKFMWLNHQDGFAQNMCI